MKTWLKAFIIASLVELPLLWSLSDISKNHQDDLWARCVAVFHSISFALLYVVNVRLETAAQPSLLAREPWIFYVILFVMQSVLLTPFVYIALRFFAALGVERSRNNEEKSRL